MVLPRNTVLELESSCMQMLKTVTLNEHDAVLPPESVAVQVTVVVPIAKHEPLVGEQTTVAF